MHISYADFLTEKLREAGVDLDEQLYLSFLKERLQEVGLRLEAFACPLSERELEVVELVAMGWGNKEIARQLGISCQTVKNHMSAILKETGSETRLDAALMALFHGWLSTEVVEVVEARLRLNRSTACVW